ncbi:hypothetical protein Bca101_023191 [Brassica carinata]
MAKKKKHKPSASGRTASSSPSSSSTRTSGTNKQASPQSPAGLSPEFADPVATKEAGLVSPSANDLVDASEAGSVPPIVNDLVAAKEAGSVFPCVNDLVDAAEAGSVSHPNSDLQLETLATVQIDTVPIVSPSKETIEVPSTPTTPKVGIFSQTPIDMSAQAAQVANPEFQTQEPSVPTAIAVINTSATVEANSKDDWAGLFKVKGKKLEKKGTPFTLPSGEMCIKIPNAEPKVLEFEFWFATCAAYADMSIGV